MRAGSGLPTYVFTQLWLVISGMVKSGIEL